MSRRDVESLRSGKGSESSLAPARQPAAAAIGDAGRLGVDRALNEPGATDQSASFSRAQLQQMGNELMRLGFSRDPHPVALTDELRTALVEAFGDDSWKSLDAKVVIERLSAAVPPAGRAGDHRPLYGQMFRDGVLDVTVGIGYGETNFGEDVNILDGYAQGIQKALTEQGFVEDRKRAAELHAQAGRPLPQSAFGMFFVKADALTFAPPAGAARTVHAVVRLVTSPDGRDGAQAAQGFKEGMLQSDAAFYGGHGRFGSGPDFDRDQKIEIRQNDPLYIAYESSFNGSRIVKDGWVTPSQTDWDWIVPLWESAGESIESLTAQGRMVTDADGMVRLKADDPLWGARLAEPVTHPAEWTVVGPGFEDFVEADANKRKPGSSWAAFQALEKAGRVRVTHDSADGNILLNETNQHPAELGSHLLYRGFKQQGKRPATGPGGELAAATTGPQYRLWALIGCRSRDYIPAVRKTPGHDSRHTDMIGTNRVTGADALQTFPAFLNALIAQSSSEEVLSAMEGARNKEQAPGEARPLFQGDGFDNNPVVPKR